MFRLFRFLPLLSSKNRRAPCLMGGTNLDDPHNLISMFVLSLFDVIYRGSFFVLSTKAVLCSLITISHPCRRVLNKYLREGIGAAIGIQLRHRVL